jgi:ubiquinone/menaquinone biosynthesis C-methylase UbiE
MQPAATAEGGALQAAEFPKNPPPERTQDKIICGVQPMAGETPSADAGVVRVLLRHCLGEANRASAQVFHGATILDDGLHMPLIQIRRRLASVFLGLVVLATVISPSRAFQQRPTVNAGNPSTIEDFKAGDANREPYQRATELLKALEVTNGDCVADVGAGSGYYVMRLSGIVGQEGKVFAEDISDASLRWLATRAKVFDLPNVEIVKGDADNPKLPADRLAAILIVDSYHHFEHVQPMLDHMLHALKPGGRMVIADYSLREHRSRARAEQVKMHEIDPGVVRAEAEQAGLHVVSCDEQFVKQIPESKYSRAAAADMWLMVAVRPK